MADTTNTDCGCGCGRETKGGRFVPGHDATAKSEWTQRILATEPGTQEHTEARAQAREALSHSPKLLVAIAKAEKAGRERAATKAERDELKAQAKRAKAEAKAQADQEAAEAELAEIGW